MISSSTGNRAGYTFNKNTETQYANFIDDYTHERTSARVSDVK